MSAGRPAFSSASICSICGRTSAFHGGVLAASCRCWSFTSGSQTPLKSGKAAIAAHSFSRAGDAAVSCAVEVLATIITVAAAKQNKPTILVDLCKLSFCKKSSFRFSENTSHTFCQTSNIVGNLLSKCQKKKASSRISAAAPVGTDTIGSRHRALMVRSMSTSNYRVGFCRHR